MGFDLLRVSILQGVIVLGVGISVIYIVYSSLVAKYFGTMDSNSVHCY